MKTVTYPWIGLQYLRAITDEGGVWQHAEAGSVAREHGYALDDSARGLIAALQYGDHVVAEHALGFLERSCTAQGVVNFFKADGTVVDHPVSYDAVGEAIWALGVCIAEGFEVMRARAVLEILQPQTLLFDGHLRAYAYAVLGYLLAEPALVAQHVEVLLAAGDPQLGWYWPEPELRYANAIIPYALIEAGYVQAVPEWSEAGLRMLDFLTESTTVNGIQVPIGNQGWYPQDGQRAYYDQQPIDPAYQVLAQCSAARHTGLVQHAVAALTALAWFWGENTQGMVLLDPVKGTCRDGIHVSGVSDNHGAENVVCYLLAQHAIELLGSKTSGVVFQRSE
jgi:hypothetical protein